MNLILKQKKICESRGTFARSLRGQRYICKNFGKAEVHKFARSLGTQRYICKKFGKAEVHTFARSLRTQRYICKKFGNEELHLQKVLEGRGTSARICGRQKYISMKFAEGIQV